MYGQNNRGYNNNRGSSNRGGSSDAAPVNVGDVIDVKVEAVGEKGDGIAKKNGFVIFVPGGKEGQSAHIKITRVLKKMAFSEITTEASTGGSSSRSNDGEERQQAPAEPKEEENFEGAEDSDNFGEEEQSSDEEEWK